MTTTIVTCKVLAEPGSGAVDVKRDDTVHFTNKFKAYDVSEGNQSNLCQVRIFGQKVEITIKGFRADFGSRVRGSGHGSSGGGRGGVGAEGITSSGLSLFQLFFGAFDIA